MDDFHVFTFDQRGHGESEFAPGGYGVWAFAADLGAFVNSMGIERFDLVGLSLGSRSSMAYARENSLRLRHLVLADMGPQMAKVGARGLQSDMTAKADVAPSTFTREQAVAFYAKQWPSLDGPSIDRLIENSLIAGRGRAVCESLRPAARRHHDEGGDPRDQLSLGVADPRALPGAGGPWRGQPDTR